MTFIELITVPFGESNHTSCALYFFYSKSWKKLLLYWFFLLQGVSMETADQCGGRKKTSFAKKWMWSKIKILRMLQWTVAGRSQMYCPASRVWGNWWRLTPSAFVLFSLFQILLFSVLIVNINAAKSCTVLDNLSVNIYIYLYIYIYIFFFFKFSS